MQVLREGTKPRIQLTDGSWVEADVNDDTRETASSARNALMRTSSQMDGESTGRILVWAWLQI